MAVNMTDSDLNAAAEVVKTETVGKKLLDGRTGLALIVVLLVVAVAGAVAFGLYRYRGGGAEGTATAVSTTEPTAKAAAAPVPDDTAKYCAVHGKDSGFDGWYCNTFTPEWENQRAAINELQDLKNTVTVVTIFAALLGIVLALVIVVLVRNRNRLAIRKEKNEAQ